VLLNITRTAAWDSCGSWKGLEQIEIVPAPFFYVLEWLPRSFGDQGPPLLYPFVANACWVTGMNGWRNSLNSLARCRSLSVRWSGSILNHAALIHAELRADANDLDVNSGEW